MHCRIDSPMLISQHDYRKNVTGNANHKSWLTSPITAEMQKVKTFTLAAFWGPKNLRQKCVIRDKFNAIKSAWFATNWILKRLKKHYLCSKFKKNLKLYAKCKIFAICFLGSKYLHPKLRDSRQSNIFTPPFIAFSIRIFTPVGTFLH